MRYIIDEKDIDFDISLRYYRTILVWVSKYGDSFVLSIRPDDYDNPNDISRFRKTGRILDKSNLQDLDYDKAKLIVDIFGRSPETTQVIGVPNRKFVEEMISTPAPPKAIAGDVSPVEDILILLGKRILYFCNDYGRSQVLDIKNDELNSLLQCITQAGLLPARIKPAPPYLSEMDKQ